MREVVGKSNIQPILTGARDATQQAVQELMQKTLDNYGSGHPGAAGADAEGRSAGPGDRILQRRAGRQD
jgi:nanoRNase/pAp phosphatase (c-di-AMP/oligoRNAs hydrolase)